MSGLRWLIYEAWDGWFTPVCVGIIVGTLILLHPLVLPFVVGGSLVALWVLR